MLYNLLLLFIISMSTEGGNTRPIMGRAAEMGCKITLLQIMTPFQCKIWCKSESCF